MDYSLTGPKSKPIKDDSPAYYLAEPVGNNDAKMLVHFNGLY